MLYMIIEHFRDGDPVPVYQRFRDHGRLAPEGLRYVPSWVTEDFRRCFQIMECEDRALLTQWTARWADDRVRGHSRRHVAGGGGDTRAPSCDRAVHVIVPVVLEVYGVAAARRPARPDGDRLVGAHRDQVLRRLVLSHRTVAESKRRAPRICDLDHHLDGRCQFHVSLSATGRTVPGVFEVTLHAGHRKRVRYRDTAAVLKCRAGPEPQPKLPPVKPPPGAVTYTCQDGILVESSTDPVCDVDQACDDTCTFGFHCPTCCGCLAPCFSQGTPYRIPVPVGEQRVLPACERGGRPAPVLECRAYPSGVACPTTTTTTLPVGLCVTDADCAIFPPECQHCELGDCEGFPTINPNGSISNVVCPIPR